MISEALFMHNMEYMAKFPDGFFDLAVVDPPYGIDAANMLSGPRRKSGNGAALKSSFIAKDWDKSIPNQLYFEELKRVSKNQIIWGGNYFASGLDNSQGWIVWDKNNGTTNFADCELAWTSFDVATRIFKYTWNGMLQQNMKDKEARIHPTQKPVALYDRIYSKYLPQGGKVLDTHLGSGSNRIAADKAGNIDFYSCENDPDHYADQEKRWRQYKSQLVLKFT